jgi:cytoskeletal protein CcmA (bactofilin family)
LTIDFSAAERPSRPAADDPRREQGDMHSFRESLTQSLTQSFRPRNAPHRDSASEPTASATTVQCPPSEASTRSVIDGWVVITGSLLSQGEVQVDGKIIGDISCTQLIVGENAIITGNVIAQEVFVRGTVAGTIRAKRVILQENARVDSEICHDRLSIEEGARFHGRARLNQDPVSVGALEPPRSDTGVAA